MWVAVDLSPRSAMFLMSGWKSFARSRGLGLERLVHFWFDGDATLSVKFFESSASWLECCEKSSSERDNGDNSPNTKLEGNYLE
ncbi:hypothetical protein D1007_43989 [Hordeum vulgare]|nr:hypothetical protein D1007_43989 [Hordeum vulgare]